MVVIAEQIGLLVRLQDFDRQIFRLRREKESKPEEIKTLEDVFKEKENAVKELDERLKRLQVERKEKEMDLESREDNIKKYQIQLYQVKTNKEYSSIEKEIASLKADNSILEEEIIKILDEIDIVKEKIAKEKGALKIEDEKLNNEKKLLLARIEEIDAELKGLDSKRIELAADVDKIILGKYERILHNKDGVAMVQVRQGACQGCFMNLPPQVINEIQMKEDLVFCENCARMLYIEEEPK